MSQLRVDRPEDVSAWRAAAVPFFAEDALRATIPLTVVTAPGFEKVPGVEVYRVREGERPALFAFRTPPFPLALALGSEAAAAALGEHRDALVPDAPLPSVTGPIPLAEAFAAAHERASGRARAKETGLFLHALGALVEPPTPRGLGRLAEARDAEVLGDFFEGFARDVHMPPDPGLRARLSAGIVDAKIYVWEVDGRPVSVAQHSETVFGWSRVRLVYTPPEERGKGYAAACVALTSRAATAGGGRACLFTDAGNPTSNALYARLGYEVVEAFREITFG